MAGLALEHGRDQLARALRRAAAEHGLPNAFTCGELSSYFGGPPPKIAGRIGKRFLRSLWDALGGAEGWGPCPAYINGSFILPDPADPEAVEGRL